jgi:hypothetical protein
MTTTDEQFEQVSELVTAAFQLFDSNYQEPGALPIPAARAALMVSAAQASATLMLVRENRATNLLAAAYAPDALQVDPALTREAYQQAIQLLDLIEDPDQEEGRASVQDFLDALGENDPADKDVTE